MKINDKLEMMRSDFATDINLYDLDLSAPNKDGWRLPSADELRAMLAMHRQRRGNFEDDWYMTSESVEPFTSRSIHFGTAEERVADVSESHWGCCRVRLVRDL